MIRQGDHVITEAIAAGFRQRRPSRSSTRKESMMAYAFAMPVLPGKAEAARGFIREVLGPRRADWDELQRR
jgi:hypothetical protein